MLGRRMESHPSPDPARLAGGGWLRTANGGFLRLVARLTPSEVQRVFGVTLLVGAVCGLVAVTFHVAIRFCESMLIERFTTSPGTTAMALLVALPTGGGLLAGAALMR